MASAVVIQKAPANDFARREVKLRRRARTVRSRNIGDNILLRSLYGVLTAVLVLIGFCYFLLSAYHAFGGSGLLVAILLMVSGGWSLVKYVLSV